LTTDDKDSILEGNQMNYYIEKHDMEIILDALEFLHEHMVSCSKEELNYPYTIDYVDGLFQLLDNSGEESWDLK